MYGGLFGELPSTKKAQSSDREAAVDAASQDNQQEKDTHQKNKDASTLTSSEKRPASVVSNLGTAGTSMAFVPSALRNRKRNIIVGAVAAANATKIPPTSSSVSSSRAITEPSKTTQPSFTDQTTTVSHIHSNQAQQNPALEEESEAMRQLHASVVDAYDPHVPNDLLAYWDRKAMEKERIELEREAKETLQRQDQLRWQLEQERESLLKSGNIEQIVQHRQQTSMGRGRGRGVSNLPAWLVQKQRETLGGEIQKVSQCTVILSNLTAPGDVDDDLAVEVKEECEKQCGPVINVVTKDAKPPLQPLVQVHVQFVSTADAEKAVQIFHGRKFGARRIIAELMRDVQG